LDVLAKIPFSNQIFSQKVLIDPARLTCFFLPCQPIFGFKGL
jgi:hypothetical protein